MRKKYFMCHSFARLALLNGITDDYTFLKTYINTGLESNFFPLVSSLADKLTTYAELSGKFYSVNVLCYD